MDIDTIVQLINGTGFPICVSIALFYKMNEDSKNHKEEINSLKEIMNEIRIAITELKDKISND